jgi:hypothetical protein
MVLMTGLSSLSLWAQDARGTLVFEVRPFTSEIKLKEKVEKQLKTSGVEWGVAEGQLVVSLLAKKFIKFDLPNLTRYGESKSLELDPGAYRVTCIGFVPEGGMSVEKMLKKGAYINQDILSFEVVGGKKTTIEVYPTIQKKSTFFIKFFTPELNVKVIEDGVVKKEGVINERTDKSIGWDDYQGPLKF